MHIVPATNQRKFQVMNYSIQFVTPNKLRIGTSNLH